MTHNRFTLFLLGLVMMLVALPIAAQEELLHVVIQIDGEAYLSHFSQPANYSDENLLTVGSFIKSTDVIEVGPGSRVVILCANRSTDEISNDTRSPQLRQCHRSLGRLQQCTGVWTATRRRR